MSDKAIKALLLIVGFVALATIFLIAQPDGDTADIVWRFSLTKIHLASQLTMPYYTPGRCGGFLLAGDAQDFIFSLYTPVSFFVGNPVWTIKITNFLLAIILAAGVYKWLKCFGVVNQNARLFVGLLVAISGYWVCFMVVSSHLWAHGLAYTPWIMLLIEALLSMPPKWERAYLGRVAALIFLFLLLINSGYYWLQVAVPLIVARVLVEFLLAGKNIGRQSGRLAIIGSIFLFAVLLSWPRLGAIYEFQITKFPRMGGALPHFQVIAGKQWKRLLVKSLFNPSLITGRFHSEFLGPFYEFNNFISTVSLVPIAFGLFRIFSIFRTKAAWALFAAGWFQASLTQRGEVADFVRSIAPIYKQITWYWRGQIIMVLFLCLFIAFGYETMLRSRFKILRVLAVVLMLATVGQIGHTYSKALNFKSTPITEIARDPNPPPKPLKNHYTKCVLSNIYGYGDDFPAELAYTPNSSVYESKDASCYNMHDVRRLAGPEADGGHFLKERWPLWPKTDSAAFERFINYKQVIAVPFRLRVMNCVSALAWLAYLGFVFMIYRRKYVP